MSRLPPVTRPVTVTLIAPSRPEIPITVSGVRRGRPAGCPWPPVTSFIALTAGQPRVARRQRESSCTFLRVGGWLPFTIATAGGTTAQRRWRRDGHGPEPG